MANQLPSRVVNMEHLARDVVVLTANGLYQLDDILEAYGLTRDTYHAEIFRTPLYQREHNLWQKRIAADSKALMREQARLFAEASLKHLHARMQDPKTKTSDVINGLRTLMELGDLAPKKDDKTSGLTVVIDFGQTVNNALSAAGPNQPIHTNYVNPSPQARPVIEHMPLSPLSPPTPGAQQSTPSPATILTSIGE